MLFSSLSSGSKQNCFYIEEKDNAILIDCGISYDKLRYFLSRIGRDTRKIKAVFITHEHLDHVRGLRSILRGLQVPVFIHPDSRTRLPYRLKHWQDLQHAQTVSFGDLQVYSFDINHDAAHTFGYLISSRGRPGIFLASDIGSFHPGILRLAEQCPLVAIESNYDLEMLRGSTYPPDIKQRILSNRGHLSNRGCIEFLKKAIRGHTRQVCLLHLSENNNTRELVWEGVRNELQPLYPQVQFYIAPRELPMELLEI